MESQPETERELLQTAETLIQNITVMALEGNTDEILSETRKYWRVRAHANLYRRRPARQKFM